MPPLVALWQNDKLLAERDGLKEALATLKVQAANADTLITSQKEQVRRRRRGSWGGQQEGCAIGPCLALGETRSVQPRPLQHACANTQL